jgi:hypothetical protein
VSPPLKRKFVRSLSDSVARSNDIGRTGHNGSEDLLRWANVNVDEFGKICEHAVSGFIYAQPLFVPGVEVEARGPTKGLPRNLGPGTRNPAIFEGRVAGLGYLAQNSIRQARREGDAVVVDRTIPVDRIVAASTVPLDVDLWETRGWPIRDGRLVDEQLHVVFISMQQIQRPGYHLRTSAGSGDPAGS